MNRKHEARDCAPAGQFFMNYGRPIGGVREAHRREIWKMVELDEQRSNQLFDILQDWETALQDVSQVEPSS